MRSTARRAASSWSWTHPPRGAPRRCLTVALGVRRGRSVAWRRCRLPPLPRRAMRAAARGAGRCRAPARRARPDLRGRGQHQRPARRRDDADHAVGRRKDELAPGDLIVVPIGAASGEGVSAGACAAELATWRSTGRSTRRAADVAAVVHAHLPAAMALTLAGEVPDPAALPETALLLPRLPFIPFATPGSAELAARIAARVCERPGAAARRGPARAARRVVGRSAPRSIRRSIGWSCVEVLCRTWRDALLDPGGRHRRAARRAILRPPSPRPGTPVRGSSRRDR